MVENVCFYNNKCLTVETTGRQILAQDVTRLDRSR